MDHFAFQVQHHLNFGIGPNETIGQVSNIVFASINLWYSTPFRPVRHTATTTILNIMSSLAEFAAEAQDELNVANRQLATSQKQQGVEAKVKQLRKKVAEWQHRKDDILKWVNEIFER